MAFFEFPHTRTYDSDLGWLIKQYNELLGEYGDLEIWKAKHEKEYLDLKTEVAALIQNMTAPVEPWDGTKAYLRYTLVEYAGDTYIALQDVPAGVLITDTSYWGLAQTIQAELNAIKADIIELESTHCKCYETMADMVADFLAADYVCKVINGKVQLDPVNDMDCGITYFEYSATAPWAFETALANGGYAVMILKEFQPQSNDGEKILPKLLYLGYSYCGVYKAGGFTTPDGTVYNVTYQSNMGPFGTDSAHAQGMQCSQFINAILRGVPYERSRLADPSYNNNEDPEGAGNILKVNGSDYYFSANQLAHFCAAKGWFKATNIMNECEIGDVIFVGNTDPDGQFVVDDWRAIGHCAIVVGKSRNTIMVMQCGSISSLTSLYTFGRIRRRPGYNDDGVNFDCISGVQNPFENTDTYYGMKGYARIPLHYGFIEPTEEVSFADGGPTAYAAAAANANFYPIRYNNEKHAKFAIFRLGGYSALNDNNSGTLMGATVQNTVYDTDGSCAGASIEPQTNMLFPYIINCDGDSNYIQLTFTRRLTGTNNGSEWYNEGTPHGYSYLHLYS